MSDPTLDDNLDALMHRLTALEGRVDASVRGERREATAPGPAAPQAGLPDYEELTRSNAAARAVGHWGEADLDRWLTPEQREQLDQLRDSSRVRWTSADLVAVGLCGVVGLLACLFDDHVDAAVRAGLGHVKQWDVVQRWERDARGMPIDWTGPGFGGPAHRVRSAGHDLGRPWEALRQIRDGEFSGYRWHDGVREQWTSPEGAFRPVASTAEALALWGKHLVADIVTPMSLPLPGWTRLYESEHRALRKFAHDAYQGSTLGQGLNVRSGLMTPALSVLTTEVIVRSHLHWQAHQGRGRWSLTQQEARKRSEMLLAGHALVGAACLGTAVARGVAGEGLLAVRHVNVPVLLRAGAGAAAVLADRRRRRQLQPPSWDDLLLGSALPWDLDAARVLATAGGCSA